MRQYGVIRNYDPKPGVSVATLAYEYKSGFLVPEHAHGSDQLIYAIRGVMEVYAGRRMWLIPPQFALWIPARTPHRIRMPAAVSMRTLYFRPGLIIRPAPGCDVLSVTPLLRELIVEAVRVGRLRVRSAQERALRDLTILHVSRASSAPTSVALPTDSRALALAQTILQNPSQPKALANLCVDAGMSLRTMQRVFQRELGTDFDSWRRQVRLMKAIELLVTGSSVKETAYAVGYNQPSAFVEAFRRAFAATPRAWARSLPNAPRPR